MLRGTCDRARLLDLVENFTPFSEHKAGLVKIIGQNHQFLGVNNAIASMLAARKLGHGRGGVFWQTQGSGKSFSMVFFAQKVLRKVDAEGLAAMRRGQSPTVQRGPYKGQELSVDHVIPLAVAPELGNVIANLELLPLRMNEGKRDKIGDRQRSLAKQLHAAGLLSKAGLNAVLK